MRIILIKTNQKKNTNEDDHITFNTQILNNKNQPIENFEMNLGDFIVVKVSCSILEKHAKSSI
jgi:hypothetical protein